MWTLIAQADAAGGLATVATIREAFARPDALAHPETLVLALRDAPMLLVWVMLVVGVVWVSHGLVLYREGVAIAALLAGTAIGYYVGRPIGGEVILALCVGILLAALAWPMMRYAVGIFTIMAGGVLIAHVSSLAILPFVSEPASEPMAWGAAAVGAFLTACLVLRVGESSAVLLTSITGSLLVVAGATGVALHLPGVDRLAGLWLMQQHLALPLALLAITAAGLFMQRGLRQRLSEPPAQPEPQE